MKKAVVSTLEAIRFIGCTYREFKWLYRVDRPSFLRPVTRGRGQGGQNMFLKSDLEAAKEIFELKKKTKRIMKSK